MDGAHWGMYTNYYWLALFLQVNHMTWKKDLQLKILNILQTSTLDTLQHLFYSPVFPLSSPVSVPHQVNLKLSISVKQKPPPWCWIHKASLARAAGLGKYNESGSIKIHIRQHHKTRHHQIWWVEGVYIYEIKSQRSASFFVLVVLHWQAQTCSKAALMRSISLHSLSLGTSTFPLDQLGLKTHRLSFRKTVRLRGMRSLASPVPCCRLHSPQWETSRHVIATKKSFIFWPRSSGNSRLTGVKYSLYFMYW